MGIAKGGPWRAATAKTASGRAKRHPTDCAVPAAAFITPGAAVAVEPVRRARRQRNTTFSAERPYPVYSKHHPQGGATATTTTTTTTTSAVGCRGAGGAPAGAGSC